MKPPKMWQIAGLIAIIACACWIIFKDKDAADAHGKTGSLPTSPSGLDTGTAQSPASPGPALLVEADPAGTIELAPIGPADDSPDVRGTWTSRRCFSQRGFGAVVNAQGGVIVTGTEALPIAGAESNPDGTLFLVHHGNARYAIYAPDGSKREDVPQLREENSSAPAWHWKNGTTLIGSAEKSPPQRPNRYPDTDVLPQSVALYLYSVGSRGEPLRLKTPAVSAGMVLRLEKVTAKGDLCLAEVTPEDYFGGKPKTLLGMFSLVGENPGK